MRGVRDERGFTLIESLCAVVITGLTVLIAFGLWQASLSAERQASLHSAVSRQAVSTIERLRAADNYSAQEETAHLQLQGVPVTEHKMIQADSGFYRITLTYSWQEGGRTREQTWAAIDR